MPIPQNKTELIVAIEQNYNKLKNEIQTIPDELYFDNDLEGHSKNTTMSIHNLISYLLGWSELVLKWNYKLDNKLEVDFPETGYKWNELGKLAQKFYKDYENLSIYDLQIKLDNSIKLILELINLKSNQELYSESWYEKWTLGRMIQLNTSSPFQNAYKRIRKWKKLKGIK